MKKSVTLTSEQFKKIESIYPQLSSLHRSTEGFLHPKLIKMIEEMQKNMEEVFQPFWDEKNKRDDEEYEKLNLIQKSNSFMTTWSMSEISADEMNKNFPGKVKKLVYQNQTLEFKENKMTWLDIWRQADKIIRLSGDTHHIFIEGISPDKKDSQTYHLCTGS